MSIFIAKIPMKLVIVESPKKSETIRRYLGTGYTVMASEGHIRDLSTRGKGGLGIDVEHNFEPDWEISPRKKGLIAKLGDAAEKADEVLLATDPDREGEAISWHLAQVLNLPVNKTKRLQFHEITKPAILKAIENPGLIDMNLVKAQETRRMEDRIIGFKVSSLLQRKIKVKSAGRVQSSTLRMIVERKEAIDAFVPQEFWTIDAEIEIEGKKYMVPLTRVDGKPFKCHSYGQAKEILDRMPETLTVTSVSKAEKLIYPKPPFSTSTMQQEAFAKYHFSNSKTQSVAQKLYEGLTVNGEHVGLITYMRTDSTRISPEFFTKHAAPFILETFGKEYLGTIRETKKGEQKIQDAHEAIRPTGTHRTPKVVAQSVGPDEAKLYRLIYCRAMASLMAPKRTEKTSVIFSGNGLDFTLSGSRVLFPGYSVIFGEFEEKDEDTLPEILEGQNFNVLNVDPEQRFTKPEPPYNEASIVKAMEEKGIGRPSTYASTIDTLIKRQYITTSKGVITPTEEGMHAVKVLQEFFPDVVSTDYTASMEQQLDKVESGEKTFLGTMNEFFSSFMETYKHASEMIQKEPDPPTGQLCPRCGRPLVYKKNNRDGQTFIGCSGYPHCRYIQKEEKESPKFTGGTCPDCGKPLVFKKNKKGEEFIGCSGFPSCRYTENPNKPEKKPIKPSKYTEADYVKPCPKCKTGYLVVKKGKKVEFLGCSNFPRCKHIEWLDKKKKES